MNSARIPLLALTGFVLGTLGGVEPSWASSVSPWQVGLQEAASPVMSEIHSLYDYLNIIIVAIVLFVLALLGYVCFRFSEKNNKTSSKTSHNTTLEIIWTAIPVVILITIAIPSLKLLYFMDKTYDPDMTLKVTGNQWYWSYEYPDHGEFTFDAIMVEEDELEEGQPRLLTTDEIVVLPINQNIRILLTSEDVIHAWALPQMGVKIDTVPGRTNETWMRIEKEGTYYGQCSELCGVNHGFMPITVKAVSQEEFEKWVIEARENYANVITDPKEAVIKLAQHGDVFPSSLTTGETMNE